MSVPPASRRSGNTARVLILVGVILQFVEVAGILALAVLPGNHRFHGIFLLAVAAVGAVWGVLILLFSYRPTADGDYGSARTPTLIFGILSLVTLSILGGILYLIAYVKLGDALHEAAVTAGGGGSLASGTVYCPRCGGINPALGKFCQRCGAPLTPP